jgi:expansin (peptidoglycan-binding protein)
MKGIFRFFISCLFISTAILSTSGKLSAQDTAQWFTGKATYYNFTGRGNCAFKAPSKPVLTAAINTPQYAGSELCGACLEVLGAKGSVVVRVEDRCPGCPYGSLDLSMTAFATIDELAKGRIPIKWRVVPCSDTSGISIFVEGGANAYFAMLRVQGVNMPVHSLEMLVDSTYRILPRKMSNFFELRAKHESVVNLRMVTGVDTVLLNGVELRAARSCKPVELVWLNQRRMATDSLSKE